MKHRILMFIMVIFLICMANQIQAQEFITDGLVSFWPLDQSSIDGDIAMDVWGGNDGKITDADVVAGRIDEGLEFSQNTSMVSIPVDPSLDLADAITLEAWIRLNLWDVPERHIIISRYDQNQGKRYCQFAVKPDVGLSVFLGHTNGSAYNQAQAGVAERGWVDNWVHVAATWSNADDGLPKLYVDGEEIGAYESQQALQDSLSLNDLSWTIGAMPGFNRRMEGTIDEVRIYDRRLSDDEIMINSQVESNSLAVQPVEKLPIAWGKIR